MITRITQQLVDRGLPPLPQGQRRIELCCSELPGFIMEIRATNPGQGTFYLRYKNSDQKTCYSRIGNTQDTSVFDARKKAKALKLSISGGADPRGEEKARKEVPTLTDFFLNQYLPYIKPRLRSWKRAEQLFRLQLQDTFGDKRLNRIDRRQMQSLHTRLLEEGLSPASCDHVLKLARRICSVAVSWSVIEVNPLSRIPLFNRDNKVEHYLDSDELERLANALQTDENRPVCSVAMFLLSTGARLNEGLRATWDQIDRKNRVWRIPASNSKSKRVRSVPLNDSAIYVLDQLGTEGKFRNLFVNVDTGAGYTTIHKVWDRLRKSAGLPKLRIHDLRHQYASFLVNSGRTLYEVQQILGHSDPSVTQRHSHLSSKSLQEAANTASVLINGAMPVPVQESSEEVSKAA